MSLPAPAAGWFPDPAGSASERWWTGEAWTEQLREPPAAEPAAEPSAEPSAEPGFALPGSGPSAFMEALARTEAARSAAATAAAAPEPPTSGYRSVAATEPAPASAHPTAAAPVNVAFTTEADPAIASRYRTAVAAEATPEPATPTAVGDPRLPGWAGRPLPGDTGFGTEVAAPPPASAPEGRMPPRGFDNKAEKTALSAGATSLIAILFVFFGRLPLVPAGLSVIAIGAGIVGAVAAARAGRSVLASLGAIAMGVTTVVVVTTVVATTWFAPPKPAWTVDDLEKDIVAHSTEDGFQLAAVTCPAGVEIVPDATFDCGAVGIAGDTRFLKVHIHSDGLGYGITLGL